MEKKGVKEEADSVERNAYALMKELREDALANAVFRGMAQEHQEALLTQAHLAQTDSAGGFGYGNERMNRYGDDYGSYYGQGSRYTEEGSSKHQNAEVLSTRTAMTPPLLIPKYIEIEVYVVKMQDSYFPLGMLQCILLHIVLCTLGYVVS